MGALRQLVTPISYLRIRHPVKLWFDWVIPNVIALLFTLVLLFLPKEVRLLGEEGLVFVVTDLIKILTGFYVASLAAVATFPRAEMDEPLAGATATLGVTRRGVKTQSILSRRRFLCYLFGYLAFMGLTLYFIGAVASLFADNLNVVVQTLWGRILKWLSLYVYLFFTSNVISTTLLGLHFMTDRIHR